MWITTSVENQWEAARLRGTSKFNGLLTWLIARYDLQLRSHPSRHGDLTLSPHHAWVWAQVAGSAYLSSPPHHLLLLPRLDSLQLLKVAFTDSTFLGKQQHVCTPCEGASLRRDCSQRLALPSAWAPRLWFRPQANQEYLTLPLSSVQTAAPPPQPSLPCGAPLIALSELILQPANSLRNSHVIWEFAQATMCWAIITLDGSWPITPFGVAQRLFSASCRPFLLPSDIRHFQEAFAVLPSLGLRIFLLRNIPLPEAVSA